MNYSAAMSALDDFLLATLDRRTPAIGYAVHREMRRRFPNLSLLEGASGAFDVEAYAREGLCSLTVRTDFRSRRVAHWQGLQVGEISRSQEIVFDATWQSHSLIVLVAHWPDPGTGQHYHYFLLGESQEVVHAFHAAVCAWNMREPDDYILVFDVNGWSQDAAMLDAIRDTTLDSLILRPGLKDELVRDVQSFFAQRDTYEEYGIPWKRGILLVGPPGNGKTHAVKAIINALEQRAIYVRLFGHMGNAHAVFERARALAPCVLVLEDLDSLVNPEMRAYFLNELDGFARNEGILTLATSNHPERLDPAILDRPSRFDRKYPFDLPGVAEREQFILRWNQTLKPVLRLSASGCVAVAAGTDDFSFAYLKELFLSSMMRWIADPREGRMDAIMEEQIISLREQMRTVETLLPDVVIQPGGPMGRHRGRGGPAGHQPQHEVPL